MEQIIHDYLAGLIHCYNEVKEQGIEEVADIINEAYENGKHIFVMGNGGSASTASHFARDLRIGTATPYKPRVKSTSLTDNMAFVTSIANDKDYDEIFYEQLYGLIEEGDVAIGISASGNSENVLRAIRLANDVGARTIGFTGFGGGKLSRLAEKTVVFSSRDYGVVEDAHMSLGHIITYMVRKKMASRSKVLV